VLAVATLSVFWIVSGGVGLAQIEAAMGLLTNAGMDENPARAFVVSGSLIDLALGLGVLVRRTHTAALLGMIAVTLGYLAAASFIVPALWLDPMGPLVKTIPAMTLALVALSLREPR